MNPRLSLDKSFNCDTRMIEPLSFKWTVLKELMTENPLRQNLVRKRVPSLVLRPLTLRTGTLFGATSGCGRGMAPPRAGLRVPALSAEGMFQAQDPGPERGGGRLDAVWTKGTGLTLRAGSEDLAPGPRFPQVSQPQGKPEVFRERGRDQLWPSSRVGWERGG